VSIDPALLEAERVERAERYVCLPYPLTQVLMVDSMDSLMLAKQMVDEEKRQGEAHRTGQAGRHNACTHDGSFAVHHTFALFSCVLQPVSPLA
jgi:hypothetical protein